MPIIYPVAGGKGGIGKSFITANLGWLLAKSRKKVLLTDLDLGSANLHTMLGVQDPGTGLSCFLNKTAPTIMETIIPCQIPGLFLLNAGKTSLEAANLPYAQSQKIINTISRLPFDFILLDLGAGTHFNTLDFFLTSTEVILIFTPEPTSIESGVRFIETVYYRKLKQVFKQHRINAIMKNMDSFSVPSISAIINSLSAEDDGRALLQTLGKISFKLIINQNRNKYGYNFGDALLKICQRHFYSNFELIGTIDHDEKILDAIISKQLFVRKYPRSRTTYDLMKTAQNLILAQNRPALALPKPFFDRNHYEILGIHPGTPSGEVRQAYLSVKSLYQDNPSITDAFFTAEEKSKILERIDIAGEVLGDTGQKSGYDRSVLSLPTAAPDNRNAKVLEVAAIKTRDKDTPDTPAPPTVNTNSKESIELMKKISSQHIISGLDLQALRTASGITMEAIFEKTRVGVPILKTIEEDRFDELPPLIYLKGFLKAYAQALQLPAGTVVDGYLKNIEKKDRYSPAKADRG